LKGLERTVGLVGVVAISISAMLGSGIFVLPGLAAAKTGPSVWLAYLAAALCILPAALSKAELATAMPTSGGTYVYIDRAVGPLWGTIAGLGLATSLLFKSAFALLGFGEYLKVTVLAVLPNVNPNFSIKPFALVFLLLIVILNILGVRKVSKVQTAVVGVCIASLMLVVLGGARGFPAADSALATTDLFTGGLGGFVETIGFIFVAFAGVTKIAAIAEEVKEPERNLPRGILLSLLIVAILYVALTLIFVGNMTAAELAGGDVRAVFTVTNKLFGRSAGIAMGVLGVLTMISMATAGVLATSRFPFAMSRDRLLPSFLSQVHPVYGTPVAGIVLIGIAIAVVILTVDIELVAKVASAIMILLYLAVNLMVIILREGQVQWYQPSYRAPFYPWLQIGGIIICAILLVMLGTKVPIAIAGITVPGLCLYFFYSRKRVQRRGVFGILGKRKELLSTIPTMMGIESNKLESNHAAVVVPLLGDEHSPEALADIATALANERSVQILHVTDVPDQVSLAAMALEETPEVTALQRRIAAMAQSQQVSLQVTPVVTRDVVQTVHDATKSLQCEWVVMAWKGKTSNRFGLMSPLGWLADHLSCNLALYKDAGVRYIRQILVYPEPGPDDALVVFTADQLAKQHNAELTFVRFVSDDADATMVQSQGDYLDQLRPLCSVSTRSLILRGGSELDAIAGATAGYDLLVMGAPPDTSLIKRIIGTDRDKLTEVATCSVLRLKTSKQGTKHPSVVTSMESGEDPHGLLYFLDESCAQSKLDITRKDALFTHVARAFSASHPDLQAEGVEKALWEREKAQNTSIGMGIALPHATVPEAQHTMLGVFTTKTALDFQSPDGSKTDVFFVTIGPPRARQTHLVLLSTLSRMIVSAGFVDGLRACESGQDIIAMLRKTKLDSKPPPKPKRDGSGRTLRRRSLPPNLRKILDARCIHAHLDVTTKGELFDEVSRLIAEDLQNVSAESLLDSFHEHELEHNTGIGLGAAAPRATLSEMGNTSVGIFTTKQPINYGAPDGVATDVFFAMVGPIAQQRLQLNVLTAVVQIISSTSALEKLREANSHDELLEAFEESVSELKGFS
jgi:APA family basic amino acid/polyamine antiporter